MVGSYIAFWILFLVYIFPAVVASLRLHRNKTCIFILNITLGWTCLGWIIALIWAFSDNAP